MGFFEKRRQKKQEATLKEMYSRINNKRVAYAVERMPDGTERVVGKDGSVNLKDGEIFVRVGGVYAFRGILSETNVAELMSRNGITVKGLDTETGQERSIVAYYDYYRK